MSEVVVLHLTDLHFGQGGLKTLWPTLRAEFYRDLGETVRLAGPIDLVVFSGDLTQRAGVDEFKGLDALLKQLWQHFASLGSSPKLFTVPGNHDLVRPPKDAHSKLLLQWPQDEEIVSEFVSQERSAYRKVVSDAFSNYTAWLNDCGVPCLSGNRGLLPGDCSATLSKAGLKIGLVGLNSAWLQLADGHFEKRLEILDEQLALACEGDAPAWVRRHEINLLITHHPESWLHPGAKRRFRESIYPPGQFTCHMYGHMHEAKLEALGEGGAPGRLSIQGRSLFGLEKFSHANGATDRSHGYSVIRFRRAEPLAPEVEMTIWPRTTRLNSAGARHLIPDFDYSLSSSNTATLRVPISRRIDERLTASSAPALQGRLESKSEDSGSEIALPSSSSDFLGAPQAAEEAHRQLTAVPRWSLRHQPWHLYIREAEQETARSALQKRRGLWILAEWGLGKDGFIFSILRPDENRDLTIYRVNCDGAADTDGLHAAVKRQTGMAFQLLVAHGAQQKGAVFIFDNVDSDAAEAVEVAVTPLTESDSGSQVILSSRRLSDQSPTTLPKITLAALDEPDSKRYISAHPEARVLTPAETSFLHQRTDGVPLVIDNVIRNLAVESLDDAVANIDLGTATALEPVPKALSQAIAQLATADEPVDRRALDLLRTLSLLPFGESLSRLRHLFRTAPFHTKNATLLLDLGLIETSPSTAVLDDTHTSTTRNAEGNVLAVPRQVRDYVLSLTSADDRWRITSALASIFFGPQWRERRIQIPTGEYSRSGTLSRGGTGNQHSVAVEILRHSIATQDPPLQVAVDVLLANLSKLDGRSRYRELLDAGRDCVGLLADCPGQERAQAIALAHYGTARRMLGDRLGAIETLDRALVIAPNDLGNSWKAGVHLDRALAMEGLKDRAGAAEAARQVQEFGEPSDSSYLQAQSILLAQEPGVWTPGTPAHRKIVELEKRARNKEHYITANNIALDLAKHATDASTRIELTQRALKPPEDFYNTTRANVALAEELLKQGKGGEITDRMISQLQASYVYLYSQRLSDQFERCHDALWSIYRSRNRQGLLLRLYYFSSILWRVFGQDARERTVATELEPIAPTASGPQFRFEYSYFLLRLKRLLGRGKQ